MQNLQIALNLTLSEVQTILAKLAPHAYAEVGLLIPKIQQQAQVQVDAASAPAPVPALVPPIVSEETFAALRERARGNGALSAILPADLEFTPS